MTFFGPMVAVETFGPSWILTYNIDLNNPVLKSDQINK